MNLILTKHQIKEFSVINSNSGVTLCESQDGAFLTLRYCEDVKNLKKLIDSITISKHFDSKPHSSIDLKYSVNYSCRIDELENKND